MTALGAVLELLYAAQRPRFLTMRAFGRVAIPQARYERPLRLWWDGPDRTRTESGGDVIVQRGDEWWTYHPIRGGQANEPGGPRLGASAADPLIFTRPLLAAELAALGETTVAGRPSIGLGVRANPRVLWPACTPADREFEVALDRATGVALRVATETRLTEIDEIAFDEVFPDELFQSPIPPGAPMQTSSTFDRDIDLAELRQTTLPFPLRLPAVLPAGARLVKATIGGGEHPVRTRLTYVVDPGAYMVFGVGQHLVYDPPIAVGRVDVVDGIELEILEGSQPNFVTVKRRYDVDAALVEVSGSQAEATAVAIALGLEPVGSA